MGNPKAGRHDIRWTYAGLWILISFCWFSYCRASNYSISTDGNIMRTHPNVTLYDVTKSVCDSHQTCNALGCGVSNNSVCNCDDACVRYGDCCWDFATTCNIAEQEWDHDDNRDLETCEAVPSNSGRRLAESYFMVGQCPSDWPVEQTRELCEKSGINDTVVHWLRVDNQQGVTFKNIYCAFCNGMIPNDIISWKISADCPSYVDMPPIWSHLQHCSNVNMQPLSPKTITKLRPCSCCHPKGSILQTVPSCSYSQAIGINSRACSRYKAPITVGQRTYDNPHCYQCDNPFNNFDKPVYCGLIESVSYNFPSTRYTVVPVSIFFDLPTLDELFKKSWKRAPKPTLKTCEKGGQQEYLFEAECEFQATVSDLCDNATSHGYIISAEIHWKSSVTGNVSDNVIVTSVMFHLADIFQVSVNKLQVVDRTFSSCVSRNDGIVNELIANQCQALLNFTFWLDYDEHGRYFDDFILAPIIPESTLGVTGDFVIRWLEIVRACRREESSPTDLCLGNLDDITNTTNLDLQNSSYVCVDEVCAEVVLTRNLKTTLYYNNASNEDLTMSYSKQACIYRWCDLYAVDINSSFDDFTFIESAKDIVKNPLQVSKTVSRWNQTHVLACSSKKNVSVFHLPHQILTLVGCVISIIALILTLITYARFPLLRRSTFVKLVMGLAATLLVGQLMLLFFLGVASYNAKACTVLSVVAHFVWLSVFTFMLFIAVELYRTFGRQTRKSVRGEKPRVFLSYIVSALTLPLLIVIPCLVLHFMRRTSLIYGDTARGCWIGDANANLLAFVLPITFILILNAVVFVATVYRLCSKQGDVFKNDARKRRTEGRRNLRISMKISTLMGFTWFFGFAATYLDYQALWYVFILLNTLQGLFIFVSFMCNGNIWRLWTR